MYSRSSSNSEAFASEFLEDLEYMFCYGNCLQSWTNDCIDILTRPPLQILHNCSNIICWKRKSYDYNAEQ